VTGHPLDTFPAEEPEGPPPLTEAHRNVGHGHVFRRPDGERAQCGGPALCRECAEDLGKQATQEQAHRKQVDALVRLVTLRDHAEIGRVPRDEVEAAWAAAREALS
jgi:hypothetical protein